MKSTTLLVNKLITKTALDPAMLVVAHTLYEIAMNQCTINADQTYTAIYQPNALVEDPLIGNNKQSSCVIIITT